MSSFIDDVLLSGWMCSIGRLQTATFLRSLDAPTRTQEQTLHSIFRRNAETGFAREYHLERMTTAEYRDAIPIFEYEQLRAYVERQLESGEPTLNPTVPVLYEQTSGTTGRPKHIPLCRDTLRAFRRIQTISSFIQHTQIPELFRGKLLPIVSPMIEGMLKPGIPYGSMSGLVRHSLPRPIRSRSIVPEGAQFEGWSYDDRYKLIAALALCCEDLSCMASANPSTFVRLSTVINEHFAELIEMIARGEFSVPPSRTHHLSSPGTARLSELRALQSKGGQIRFAELWPRLAGVVTWTSGNCAALIPRLKSELDPSTKVVEMGYLASEFWGTIVVDVEDNRAVPTIGDNFFEFIEPELWERGARETKLLTEIEVGRRYYIIVTTANGLYRYFINDMIDVTGQYHGTPTIAFVQKGRGVTTLTGEKLYEGHVIEAVALVCEQRRQRIDHYIMLAHRDRFQYTLYCESDGELDACAFGNELEAALAKINTEYAAKVASGRLSPASVRRLGSGTFDAYQRQAVSAGQREGQFKMIKLQYSDEIGFDFDGWLWSQS